MNGVVEGVSGQLSEYLCGELVEITGILVWCGKGVMVVVMFLIMCGSR